ncbi:MULTISPECIES: roadblock/LC7 domain-containing protein [Streptomyces]|jgi:uncharacterized protein|uniref:Roadblock/LC7 domain-containing protein n=1 Tax=Streptomyces doudnae TaxID=3075536 RepID=A0ABD5ETD6_9ACTN|nr:MULTISPECIES: roadblock/LC7 domain-containing protein [unclassified Streptomyces]MDT0437890.1 roadblock/LC7 domain-containing protein [Streptomyces sp. DSM 41981]MYQ66934.1 hypothetical protein [Streptomyces sp. SID4950]SCE27677.1 hypothetical protein GA0115242_128013 [Streptomyces sp. SolWspMP-5a-2]
MAAEPEILDELRRLRARVPQLTGALVTGTDGTPLAQDTPGVDAEAMAALTAAAHGAAVRLADLTGQGAVRELVVHGVYGYVAAYTAGGSAVLTLLAQDRVNLGRLLLEGRRSGARVGELVDARRAAQAAPARPRPAKPAAPGAGQAGARTRTARAARTANTDARTTTDS